MLKLTNIQRAMLAAGLIAVAGSIMLAGMKRVAPLLTGVLLAVAFLPRVRADMYTVSRQGANIVPERSEDISMDAEDVRIERNEDGSTATVTFVNPTDPSAADAASLHYAYDFDNDGVFEVGDGAYAGSVTASSATVPAGFLADGRGDIRRSHVSPRPLPDPDRQ